MIRSHFIELIMQVTQCDFRNKGKSGWTNTDFFDLAVPMCNLCVSMINSVLYPMSPDLVKDLLNSIKYGRNATIDSFVALVSYLI